MTTNLAIIIYFFYLIIFFLCRHFNGTARAREFLEQQNYVEFNLLLAEIKDPRNFKYNYFMESC